MVSRKKPGARCLHSRSTRHNFGAKDVNGNEFSGELILWVEVSGMAWYEFAISPLSFGSLRGKNKSLVPHKGADALYRCHSINPYPGPPHVLMVYVGRCPPPPEHCAPPATSAISSAVTVTVTASQGSCLLSPATVANERITQQLDPVSPGNARSSQSERASKNKIDAPAGHRRPTRIATSVAQKTTRHEAREESWGPKQLSKQSTHSAEWFPRVPALRFIQREDFL